MSTRLHGEGALTRYGEDWIDFLSRLARLGTLHENTEARESPFVARNFVLDEGVVDERAESYRSAGGVTDHGTTDAWSKAHGIYLEAQVALTSDDDGPPRYLDPSDSDEIPETFRFVDPDSPFLGTDASVWLVRVEELDFIARKTNRDAGKIKALVERTLDGGKSRSPRDEQALTNLFADWHGQLDQRPVYAGFWEDVKDLFDDEQTDEWADALRERLGLLHTEPRGQRTTMDIVVFRYPVRDVPRILGTGGKTRPLLPPTVLDGRFSGAFCPSPRGSATGHVVNLSPEAGIMRREVLHPRFAFRASHLWRLGSVTRRVDRGQLPEHRAVHIILVQSASGRDDYAQGTDWDLFR